MPAAVHDNAQVKFADGGETGEDNGMLVNNRRKRNCSIATKITISILGVIAVLVIVISSLDRFGVIDIFGASSSSSDEVIVDY